MFVLIIGIGNNINVKKSFATTCYLIISVIKVMIYGDVCKEDHYVTGNYA